MKTALFDTNILIDHLKGKVEAVKTLQDCIENNYSLACSLITRIELLSGVRPGEEQALKSFIRGFIGIPITEEIADIAGSYMIRFRKSHGINIADAIIAASAKAHDAQLYTLNARHFPMDDISLIKPY